MQNHIVATDKDMKDQEDRVSMNQNGYWESNILQSVRPEL